MFTYKLLSGGLTRQTPTIILEVSAGLRNCTAMKQSVALARVKTAFAPEIIIIVETNTLK